MAQILKALHTFAFRFSPKLIPLHLFAMYTSAIGDKIEFAEDEYDALQGADALFISTEWPEFRTPEFERVENALKNKIIFDGRNLYSNREMEEKGYKYFSIGRPNN